MAGMSTAPGFRIFRIVEDFTKDSFIDLSIDFISPLYVSFGVEVEMDRGTLLR